MDDFQIDGIRQDVTESLKSAMRYSIAPNGYSLRVISVPQSRGTANCIHHILPLRRPVPPVLWSVVNVTAEIKDLHQTDTACSWLVCHSRGEHCANCIHLPRLSRGPAAQFFGEASRASPQHGWRSAYSLRETLSPTQDQNQHSTPHTHQVH